MIKKYIEYLKDNPKGLWFKRKLYGWGWTPVKWQGWFVIALYVAILFLLLKPIKDSTPASDVMYTFVLPVALLTLALLSVCYWKGEKPRWQWGNPKKD